MLRTKRQIGRLHLWCRSAGSIPCGWRIQAIILPCDIIYIRRIKYAINHCGLVLPPGGCVGGWGGCVGGWGGGGGVELHEQHPCDCCPAGASLERKTNLRSRDVIAARWQITALLVTYLPASRHHSLKQRRVPLNCCWYSILHRSFPWAGLTMKHEIYLYIS